MSHSTIPPTHKGGTRSPATRDVPHVHHPITPRVQGHSSIGHVPHRCCPFHPREQGHDPSTVCHWGHILCALSLPLVRAGCAPRTRAFGDVPRVPSYCRNRDMSPVPHQVHVPCALPPLPMGAGMFPQGHVALGTRPMCTVPSPCSGRDISPCHVLPVPCPSRGAEQGHVPMPCATGTHPCRMVPSHGTCPSPVRRPDGRGRPARRGPARGQAGGQ